MSDSSGPHGLQPTRLLGPWDSPGKSTGASSHFLLQGIFPSQASNPSLPHYRQILYLLSHQGSPLRVKVRRRTFLEFLGSTPFPVVLNEQYVSQELLAASHQDQE